MTEVMVSMTIFGIISVVLISILNTGFKNWKKLDSRLDADNAIAIASSNINAVIKNTYMKSVDCNAHVTTTTPEDGGTVTKINGNGWLCCDSVAEYSNTSLHWENMKCDVDGSTFRIKWKYKVLFFTAKQKNCPCGELGMANSNVCPHKYLIRRFYPLTEEEIIDATTNKKTYVYKWNSESSVIDAGNKFCMLSDSEYSPQPRFDQTHGGEDKVLARNVIAFIPEISKPNERPYGVSYKLKLFKPQVLKEKGIKISEEHFQKTMAAVNLNDGDTIVTENGTAKTRYQVEDPLYFCTVQANFFTVPINSSEINL